MSCGTRATRRSSACSPVDVARIFDQLRPLFDRGLLVPPAVNTWPLENSAAACQTVLDGPAGIKQVLLLAGGGAQGDSQ